MMAAPASSSRLIERLPEVRGRYSESVALSGITWFRVGGPAEVVFRPADLEDLTAFLERKPAEVPVTVIGVGSNLLVRDGGIDGVVVRLGRGFANIDISDSNVRVGASALDLNVAFACLAAGVARLEFLRGIPGTIGGALRMNAGAHGHEIVDVLVQAQAVDPQGRLHRMKPGEMDFGYRHCGVRDDWIFVGATLRGEPGEREAIAARMGEIKHSREASQPLRSRTGGSTFVNPPDAKAWELIDQAGCRGLERGGAKVSEQHCNFLINTGEASAADIEALGEEVRRRVAEVTGVTLEWEIRRIGNHENSAAAGRGARA
jgi:UDP-N-acetylmuramate dehydrogenase